jgi:hypothetical protein
LRHEIAGKRVKKCLYNIYRRLPVSLSLKKEMTLMAQVSRMEQAISRVRRIFARKSPIN